MDEDLANLTIDDLQILFETFQVVRNGNYSGSEVQVGFKMVFKDADRDGDWQVTKAEFFPLMSGYFASKHIKPTQLDLD